MKKIYIVLTYTGTILSKLIKIYTRKEYSHVSIALDEDLQHMYSFGRLNAYNPFFGGFVHERVDKGTYRRFKKTKTRIYSLQVLDENYEEIVNVIKDIKNNRREYHYNIIGLICVAIHLKFKREKSFYCAEFVKYVLEKSNINNELPDLIKPEDFNNIKGLDIVYSGILREYLN